MIKITHPAVIWPYALVLLTVSFKGACLNPHSHIQDYNDLANRPNLMFRVRYYANFAVFFLKRTVKPMSHCPDYKPR